MNQRGITRIQAFSEVNEDFFTGDKTSQIKNEILDKPKSYILGIDENEYINYLIEKYTLEPLFIDLENGHMGEPVPSKAKLIDEFYGRSYIVDSYVFTITYPYSGSTELFKLKPNPAILRTEVIYVDNINKTVSISFEIPGQNVEIFNRKKTDTYNNAFSNYIHHNISGATTRWNSNLPIIVRMLFREQKDKFLKENNFFEMINVKVNDDTKAIFTTPTITKKVIPQPTVPPTKKFSSEPTMTNEAYQDILNIIYVYGKNMEKKPSLYTGKDEEGLRDQFVSILETRYDNTTATGETFNRGGKTDIILKYAVDGSNLFVAECKFWHGSSEFHKAITQLFDRYLTWRDSKTALLMFVKNNDFSNVLNVVQTDIKTHPYFVKEIGKRGESSFSYIFRLPQDPNKQVYFEVMAFHYDK